MYSKAAIFSFTVSGALPRDSSSLCQVHQTRHDRCEDNTSLEDRIINVSVIEGEISPKALYENRNHSFQAKILSTLSLNCCHVDPK